ncbi:hypothetical protein HYH03_015168 [Edaphochlamys debaryana]|uniref:Uncharacterized protein n=1 Tax=Edaphochlamys debaryana TaxID=47281 RepID=A0A836BRA2_9CHLO|nr:hypothetical protein HYH03_015168 [Edaphochlamys debaryana]|eukprot:KAG2486206.1 hypothetical protein HYH03_015168 [Edaphochlamys debaryana]
MLPGASAGDSAPGNEGVEFGILTLAEQPVFLGSAALEAAVPRVYQIVLRDTGPGLTQVWVGHRPDDLRLFRLRLLKVGDEVGLEAPPLFVRALGGLEPGDQPTLRRAPSGRLEAHVVGAPPSRQRRPAQTSVQQPTPAPAARAARRPSAQARPTAARAAPGSPPFPFPDATLVGNISVYNYGGNTYLTGVGAIRAAYDVAPAPRGQSQAMDADLWAPGTGGGQQLSLFRVTVYSGKATRITAVGRLMQSLGLQHGDQADLWRLTDGRVVLWPQPRPDADGGDPGSPVAAARQLWGQGRTSRPPPLPPPPAQLAAGSTDFVGYVRVYSNGTKYELNGPEAREAHTGCRVLPGSPDADPAGDRTCLATLFFPRNGGTRLTGAATLVGELGTLERGDVVALWRLGGEGQVTVLATAPPTPPLPPPREQP